MVIWKLGFPSYWKFDYVVVACETVVKHVTTQEMRI